MKMYQNATTKLFFPQTKLVPGFATEVGKPGWLAKPTLRTKLIGEPASSEHPLSTLVSPTPALHPVHWCSERRAARVLQEQIHRSFRGDEIYRSHTVRVSARQARLSLL